jgi:pyridinium-3,5-biscarboxylic acid mononucleotide sulfurtransferase
MIQNDKYDKLIAYLKGLDSVVVAFSGGVDSAFVLAAAKIALGDQVVGITIDSPALPRYELEDAQKIAALVNARHIVIRSETIEPEIKMNPVNRCYFCKKVEYGEILDEAKRLGYSHVLDGSNQDDLKDTRPGMKARDELKVISPLQVLQITKAEIREFSKALNLPTWDKPAYACLFSRIPYGQEIKPEDLLRIEKSEKFLIDNGFRTVRVRSHGNLARIEVAPEDRVKLLSDPQSAQVFETLRSFGFQFVTIDLQGYKMGGFNTVK